MPHSKLLGNLSLLLRFSVGCSVLGTKSVNFSGVLLVAVVFAALTLLVQQPAYSQIQPSTPTNFLSSLDTYVKVIAGVVAAITASLGIPVAFLQIRKTIAEIRKTELEAKKLEEQTGVALPVNHDGHRIIIDHSDNNNIQILVDPRFSSPLLILLDFVIVYILLALAGYAISVFLPGKIGQIILTIVGAGLLLPLLVEALRLRGVLRSAWSKRNQANRDGDEHL